MPDKKEYIIVFLLAALQFIHIVDFMIIMPLGPQLMRVLDITPSQFGWLVSAYTFSAAVSGITGAFLLDRFDRKKALLWIFTGFAAGTLFCGLAFSYEVLVLARIITGFFGGITGALIYAIVADIIPYQRRGWAMGIVMAGFSAAAVLGVPAGLYFATLNNWQTPFFILGGGAFILCFAIHFIVPPVRKHLSASVKKSPFTTFHSIRKSPDQQKAILLMLLIIISQFTIIPYISPYMVNNIGFSEKQLTFIYIAGGAFTIFTGPLVGRLSDRFGYTRMFTIAVLVSLIPMFILTNLPRVSIPLALVVTTLFFICISGRMIPSVTVITSTAHPDQRGGFMSIIASTRQLASGIASLTGGWIIIKGEEDTLLHFDQTGYVGIAISLITILVIRRIKPQTTG